MKDTSGRFARPPETADSPPTQVVFDHHDPEDEARRESLLSLGNGILHMRASAPEGGQHPGLYRAGCYARLTGTVEGEDVSTDSLANLPSWLALTPDMPDRDIESYEQRLDMATATLSRRITFRDGTRRIEWEEERFLSMAHPHLGALRVRVSADALLTSGIDTSIRNDLAVTEGGYDPDALTDIRPSGHGDVQLAQACTKGTGTHLAVAARTRMKTADGVTTVEKVGAVITSRDHAVGAVGDAALNAVRAAPDYETLREEHVRAWAQLWGRCHIRAEDDNLARALNLHAFHLLQTASPHAPYSDAGLPSRGWQEAYHGQIFWDETLSLPFLSLHLPEVVRSALIHRFRRLDAARERAKAVGLRGALYPWRSGTTGHEETPEYQCNPKSGNWMRDDTRYQYHVGSAIAHNVWRYFLATRDTDFMAGYGAELMVEIARMWASLAKPHPDHPQRFTLRGVVGPDEFHTRYPDVDSPGLNDDTYTNIMASWTLLRAIDALTALPQGHRAAVAARLALDEAEPEMWEKIATSLHLVRDAEGLFLPFDHYDRLEPFDMEAFEQDHPGERLDWFIEAQGRDINALQVQKQATFAMAAHLLSADGLATHLERMGHPASHDQIRRTILTNLARTSHDSSLSNLIYASALATLEPDMAARMFRESLHPDEQAGHSGTEKGIHLGAMGATLDIAQRLFLGLSPTADALKIAPLSQEPLGVSVLYRSCALRVDLDGTTLRLEADAGNPSPLPLRLAGCRVDLAAGERREMPLQNLLAGSLK